MGKFGIQFTVVVTISILLLSSFENSIDTFHATSHNKPPNSFLTTNPDGSIINENVIPFCLFK